VASGFKTSSRGDGRCIVTWRITLKASPEKQPAAAAMGLLAQVVGATYPEQLAELRQAMPHTFFLIPGFGAQGGTAKDCTAAFDANGSGAIVNNSRGIIFAHARPEYRDRFGASRLQAAVEAATREMIDQLNAERPAS